MTMQTQTLKSVPDKVDALSCVEAGKRRRLGRLFSERSGKSLIVPMDDSLIFGPSAGLEMIGPKLKKILQDPPDAILAFPGLFRSHANLIAGVGGIVNITASTTRSVHTRKSLVGSVHQAVQLGLDAVAVHVNVGSKFESEMLSILGAVARDCESFGMPLLAIMYPRTEATGGDDNYEDLKNSDQRRYAELVAHAARVGVDLGADVIKTKYTGDEETFRAVVDACSPVPVVVAGGSLLPIVEALQMAHQVVSAGGGGISFGRNVFSRTDPRPVVSALKAIVHDGRTAAEAHRYIEATHPT